MLKFRNLIIYEDDNYIIINKPYGYGTLDDRIAPQENIISMARQYHPEAKVCHRLDKETSGLLAIAKNQEAYKHLALQFENREVAKLYHAIVESTTPMEDTIVDLPVHKSAKGYAKIDKGRGKEAVTIFNTVKIYKKHSLVACQPITGRLHQIRVHLASMNTPIISDTLYGGRLFYLSSIKKRFNLKKGEEEKPLINRIALHAKHLWFKNPEAEEMQFECEYPKDMAVLLKQLEKNS